MSLPPSLRFYVEHSREMDALYELEEPPSDVSASEWSVFQAVRDRLNQHVASLVLECREAAKAALIKASPKLHFFRPSSRAAAATHWNAWTYVAQSGSKLGHWVDLSFIVRVDPDVGAAVIVPTMSARGGRSTVDSVQTLLQKKGLVARKASDWAGYSCVALEGTRIHSTDDIDSLVKACARTTSPLAPHLVDLFAISAQSSRS